MWFYYVFIGVFLVFGELNFTNSASYRVTLNLSAVKTLNLANHNNAKMRVVA